MPCGPCPNVAVSVACSCGSLNGILPAEYWLIGQAFPWITLSKNYRARVHPAPSTNTAGPYTIPRPFCKKSILEDNVEEARRFGPQINVPGLASFHRDGFRQVARLVN